MTGINRRQVLVGASALAVAGFAPLRSRRVEAADRVQVAVMGLNGRGHELARSFAKNPACNVKTLCDVDPRALDRVVEAVVAAGEKRPAAEADIRRVLEDKSIDALVIAAPDHWHAPATWMALAAGKHVYVEKPCGHNAREGEILVAAAAGSDRVVQMGNQQRSAPESIEAMQMLRDGFIGRPYLGRSWYANNRQSIGRGQNVPVPDWLDWDLWQGPAPRRHYLDNIVHYHWHWRWHWGTGEICNNGTHEIDVCRWALSVDIPTRVSSAGGRFHFDDDWEAFDTQIVTYDFEDEKTIVWEGRSCNGLPVEGRGRGSAIHGTEGTLILDRSGYVFYDAEHQVAAERSVASTDDALDTRGGGSMTDRHIDNFLQSIRGLEKPNAPISDAATSVLLCHLGNVAQRVGRGLQCDAASGRPLGDPDAASLWGRSYEPGWEPPA